MPELNDSERDVIREEVRALMDATGWSASHLAQEAGLAPSTLSRFLNQDVKHTLKYSTVRQLIIAALDRIEDRLSNETPGTVNAAPRLPALFAKYGIDGRFLARRPRLAALTGRTPGADGEGPGHAIQEMMAGRGLAEATGPYQRAYDLPVLGAARGGEQSLFFDNGSVHERIPRPPNLEGVDNAFAVYMVGDSMEPRYFAGEYLYVNPNRPPNKGCFVVVELLDGSGMVKQFVRRDAETLLLRQFNPDKDIPLVNADVKSVYRIVGSGEG